MEYIDSLVLSNIYRMLPHLSDQISSLQLSQSLSRLGKPIVTRNLRQIASLPVETAVQLLVGLDDLSGLRYLKYLGRLNCNEVLIEAIRQEKKRLVDYLLARGPTNYDEALHEVLLLAGSETSLVIRDSIVSYFQLWLSIQWTLQLQDIYFRGMWLA